MVATTRPETMLGDTGVAVNPKDERFKHLVGKTVKLPLVDREIPIFADWHVDMEFGTGCVKTTPAHDPNDLGHGRAQRPGAHQHLRRDGRTWWTATARFSGMDRDEAREAVVAAFDELGLLDKVEDHDHSRDDVLPLPHEARAVGERAVVRGGGRPQAGRGARGGGRLHPVPSRALAARSTSTGWQNLKDWCISRQLWWGHRIPMFYCDECGLGRRVGGGRRGVPRVRRARAPGRGRARHVVSRRSCGRSPRWAGPRRAWRRRR